MKPAKVYKWQKDLVAQQQANTANRIAQAQSSCMPGQHVLTCSTCGVMGIYPIYQQQVTHMGGGGYSGQIHPGQITSRGQY